MVTLLLQILTNVLPTLVRMVEPVQMGLIDIVADVPPATGEPGVKLVSWTDYMS